MGLLVSLRCATCTPGHCRLVPGPLAGEALGNGGCGTLIVLAVIAVGGGAGAEEPRSAENSTATVAHGGWEPWTAEAVTRYQAQGRPVFVDFTARRHVA